MIEKQNSKVGCDLFTAQLECQHMEVRIPFKHLAESSNCMLYYTWARLLQDRQHQEDLGLDACHTICLCVSMFMIYDCLCFSCHAERLYLPPFPGEFGKRGFERLCGTSRLAR